MDETPTDYNFLSLARSYCLAHGQGDSRINVALLKLRLGVDSPDFARDYESHVSRLQDAGLINIETFCGSVVSPVFRITLDGLDYLRGSRR
ncbi:hypothetical protein COV20_01710 [Candidatus Woesearchaeota archaeon CG10_big_fil_rev_8_21_14_0_10_45_16]|nr:MAG: hypothetical protein COV20_01710 [Candidatus Woesearchaeota archaeon CG10_big_fil_rev_8_21_14_0_10_45_16]